MSSSTKVPTSFWVISGIALVWNLLGAMAYVIQVTMSPETMAELPPAEQAIYASLPSWVTGTFAIAVWAGVIGCVLLLLKKRLAVPVLVVSCASALLYNGYYFFATDMVNVIGMARMILPILVIAVCLYLVYFSKGASDRGWLA